MSRSHRTEADGVKIRRGNSSASPSPKVIRSRWTTERGKIAASRCWSLSANCDYLTFTFMKNDLALSTAGVAVNFMLPSCGYGNSTVVLKKL